MAHARNLSWIARGPRAGGASRSDGGFGLALRPSTRTGAHERQRRRSRATLALALAAFGAGCNLLPTGNLWTVNRVSDHGPFRMAVVQKGSDRMVFYFPAGACPELLRPENVLAYQSAGTLGRLEGRDSRCEPVGVGGFWTWVRRRGRPPMTPLKPRETAHFRVLYSDDELVIVRGRFPLGELVFFPGGQDAVAFLPRHEVCQRFIEQESGPMEYSRTQPEVIWLGSGGGRCPILGLAQPLEP